MNAILSRDFARLHDGIAEGVSPGRLWSLWDMLKFNAAPFYQTSHVLWNFRVAVEDSEGDAKAIFQRPIRYLPNSHEVLRSFKENATKLKELLGILGANVTLLIVDELLRGIDDNENLTTEGVAKLYRKIDSTLRRELSLVALLSLNPAERSMFEGVALFGTEFENRFQTDGAFELDEAAKCLGLGRPTAGVFHLMRLLEIGITSLARCLGIPDPVKPVERNWGRILERIWNDGILKKWPNTADRLAGDGAFFEGLHASLDAVKNPWRNSTMHVEKKYTDDEAQHIFVAVKGFMKKLASRMDEDGLPLA